MEEYKKEIEKEIEKRVEKGMTMGITILIQVVVAFLVAVVVFKFVWAWVVPDLFPGAVAQGLINSDLTWLAAVKLAVLVSVLSGFYPSLVEDVKRRL